MKNIKNLMLTLGLLYFSGFSALAMEDNKIEKSSSEFSNVKSVKIEDPGFNDDAIILDENSPVILVNKDYNYFDKSNVVIEHVGTGNITCITSQTEVHKYQLESKRFFVKEGDKIKVSYRVHVHPGGNVLFGLLNTQKNGWYGSLLALTGGMSCEKIFNRVVPKDETETSLVFWIQGTKDKPVHSSFTIENLKINKM